MVAGRALASEGRRATAGWRAPTLETLERQRKHGYTEFDLQLDAVAALAEADAISYAVRVNGTAVYFDGFAPDLLKDRYDPSRPFGFRFGLENLDFSGGDRGYERIQVEITFWRGSNVVRRVVVEQPYAALRPLPERRITQDGVSLLWSGKYVDNRPAERFEVFLQSTPDLAAAAALKALFDARDVRLGESRVVAVLRPPFHTNSYGVAIGIEQPTKQVAFLFDEPTANRICGAVMQLRANKGLAALVRPDTFLYEVRPRAAFKACSKIR